MRFLLYFIKDLLQIFDNEDNPRADMYLPFWLLVFGILLIIIGIVSIANLFIHFIQLDTITSSVVGIGTIIFGLLAILCWKNQSIRIISDKKFEYTTFLGNKKIYRFYDIKGIKKNTDSITLYVANDKVHIESCAILSARLVEKINEIRENGKENY